MSDLYMRVFGIESIITLGLTFIIKTLSAMSFLLRSVEI